MAVSLKTDLRFPESGQHGHGSRIIHFVEIKVRVTPEKRAIIKDHAEKMGESATAFINRAIDEAMKRDQESNPET